ncbi:dnaJ domain-containing protein [Ditylenchus destructor]|nr:dnaJ domain-containing protein [Ditylenchus destructor]
MNQIPENSNYYDILGLVPSATEDDVKRAYRKLSLQCHPDKVQGRQEEFEKLVEAYKVLSDPELRSIYDAHGKENLQCYRQMEGYGVLGRAAQWLIKKKTAYQRPTASFSPNAADTSSSNGSLETCRCCANNPFIVCLWSGSSKRRTAYQRNGLIFTKRGGTSSSSGSLRLVVLCQVHEIWCHVSDERIA